MTIAVEQCMEVKEVFIGAFTLSLWPQCTIDNQGARVIVWVSGEE